MEELLRGVYPEYSWQTPRFTDNPRVPRGYWGEPANQKTFLEDAAQRLNIREVSRMRT